MKITAAEASILNVPEDDPLANMPEEAGRTRPIVIVRLRTDQGLEGIGVTLYGGRLTRALHAAVQDLAAATIGEDPMRIEAIVAKLRPGTFLVLTAPAMQALWSRWDEMLGHHRRYGTGSLARVVERAAAGGWILAVEEHREVGVRIGVFVIEVALDVRLVADDARAQRRGDHRLGERERVREERVRGG